MQRHTSVLCYCVQVIMSHKQALVVLLLFGEKSNNILKCRSVNCYFSLFVPVLTSHKKRIIKRFLETESRCETQWRGRGRPPNLLPLIPEFTAGFEMYDGTGPAQGEIGKTNSKHDLLHARSLIPKQRSRVPLPILRAADVFLLSAGMHRRHSLAVRCSACLRVAPGWLCIDLTWVASPQVTQPAPPSEPPLVLVVDSTGICYW